MYQGRGSYFFQANFATSGAMNTAYPASGAYSVGFTGGGTLTGGAQTVSSGLDFTANTFPVTPLVTGLTNGAAWVASQLNVSTSGNTTLTINSGSGDFPGYSAGVYGASVGFGLQDQSGNLVGTSGGSKNLVFSGSNNTATSTIMITGSSLTAGQTYTLTIQYGLAAGSKGSATLAGTPFNIAPIYYSQTQISILAVPEPADAAALLGVGALGLFALRRRIRNRAGESA